MKDLELLTNILSIQSVSRDTKNIASVITEIATAFGATVTEKEGNLYVVKGVPTETGYPCIVSHMDTVHKIVPEDHFKVYQFDDFIMGFNTDKKSPSGIGGDDKVGVYIALSMIKNLDNIKSCFFKDEEIGCLGSGCCDMEFFDDVRYVLQCDRKGNSDFVNKISSNTLQTKEFMEDITDIITEHSYKFHDGGTTDVGKLYTRGLKVCSANMSCGYYNPHSDEEVVCISDVFNCEEMVFKLLTQIVNKYEVPVYVPYTPPAYNYNNYNNNNYNNRSVMNKQWDDEFDEYGYAKADKLKNESKQKECWSCNTTFAKEDLNEFGLCTDCNEHHLGKK